jgi:hypothetical protein
VFSQQREHSRLKTYLYPAIANEILLRENVLEQVDTVVTESAISQMADNAVPEPFSRMTAADRMIQSREEELLARMRDKLHGE